MSAETIDRDPIVVERLQQLIGAIKMLQKMVGNDDQSWLAENVAEARTKGPESAVQVFHMAVQNLHASVSRFTLIFKDATKPEQVGTYAETMEKALVGIVQTSQTMLTANNIHTLLKNSVNKVVLNVLNVCIKLAEDMSTSKVSKNTAHYTGQVWADCDALEGMNLSQTIHEYCDKLFRTQATALREAVEELEEALEEDDETEEKGEEGEEEDQDMFLDFTFAPADREILPGCILILKAVNSFTAQLKKVTTGIDDDTLFRVYTHSQDIFTAIDNFSTAIYPPQVTDDVITQAQNFKRLQESIVSTLLDSNMPQENRDHITKLQAAVNGIFDKAIGMIQSS